MDPAQFSQWFADLAPRLTLYARQWLDADAAGDAVQGAFVRLLGQRTEPQCVKAWLFRAVRNQALDMGRGQRRRAEREKWTGGDIFESAPDDLIDGRAAAAALGLLPGEQREVVVLRIWGDLSWPQIAELTGVPTSTLFSRYKAALAAIRARLEHPCTTNH